eukprot:2049407-Pleurochrysis_carterae.AAC.1
MSPEGSTRWSLGGEAFIDETREAGEQQGPEGATAQCLRRCRSVSCAKAACDAVEPRDAGCAGHPPPAQIRRLRLARRRGEDSRL